MCLVPEIGDMCVHCAVSGVYVRGWTHTCARSGTVFAHIPEIRRNAGAGEKDERPVPASRHERADRTSIAMSPTISSTVAPREESATGHLKPESVWP